MDELIKSLKNKLSADKDKAKEHVKDDAKINEDGRTTLEKVDTDHIVDAAEVADQINEISSTAKKAVADSEEPKTKASPFNILAKYKQVIDVEDDDEDPLVIQDDVSFLD